MNITVSLFTGGFTDTVAQRLDMPWQRLVQNLQQPPTRMQADDKMHLPLFKLATFIGDTRKEGSPGPDFIWGVEGDYDGEQVSIAQGAEALKSSGIACVLSTTARHTQQRPRWRVFAPLSGRTPIGERARLLGRVNAALGGILANESFEPSRCYFIGRLRGAEDYECVEVLGAPVDTLSHLPSIAVDPELHKVEKVESTRAFELATAKLKWPSERALVESALAKVDPDCEYKKWIKIGAAIYSASGGEGLDVFDAWSERAGHRYPGAEAIESKWRDLGKMSAIKAGTIFWTAREAGWDRHEALRAIEKAQRKEATDIGEGDSGPPASSVLTLAEALENLVHIGEGNRAAPRSAPWKAMPFSDYRALTAASVEWVGEGKKARPKPVLDLWLAHPDRISVHTDTFAPGQGEWCVNPDGIDAINLWKRRPLPQVDVAIAKPFFDHVAYLVPVEAERERFLDWLAHIEQRPEELPQGHYLHVAKETGIGRNWMAYALARVWAGNVALGVDIVSMLEGAFNGQISRKVLAVVDELHEGQVFQSKQRMANRLKSILTEETRLINPKYGRQRTEFNCCRWLMFSNHDAALPMDENDRRVFVIENPRTRRGPEYYAHLYSLLKQKHFTEAVRAALAARDIGRFNPGEIAHMNQMKRVVIEAAMGDIEKVMRDLMKEWPGDIVSASQVRGRVAEYMGVAYDKAPARFDRAAEAQGMRPLGRIKGENNATLRLWCLRNFDVWATATSAAWKQEYERGAMME